MNMASSDLLARTTYYRLRELSPFRHNNDADFLAFYEDVDEDRPQSRRRDSSANRTIPPPVSSSIPRSTRYNHENLNEASDDHPLPFSGSSGASVPILHTAATPENPGFEVTTTCDDPSSDEEEPSSAATLADLYRRDRLPPPYSPSTDEDDDDGLERAMRRAGRLGLPSSQRRNNRKAEPSKFEVAWSSNTSDPDADTRMTKDVLPPHAKFFIKREKSVVSIKFDPPV